MPTTIKLKRRRRRSTCRQAVYFSICPFSNLKKRILFANKRLCTACWLPNHPQKHWQGNQQPQTEIPHQRSHGIDVLTPCESVFTQTAFIHTQQSRHFPQNVRLWRRKLVVQISLNIDPPVPEHFGDRLHVWKLQTCDAIGELLKVTVPQLVDRLTALSDGQNSISAIIRYLERGRNKER